MITTPKNKFPGNDSLTTEFYQFFWHDIKDFFISSINCSQMRKEFSVSQKQAIIKLIEKKGKDKSNTTIE